MGADIVNMQVQLFKDGLQFFFESKAPMIGAERDDSRRRNGGVHLIGWEFNERNTTVTGDVPRGWRDDGTGFDLEFASRRYVSLRYDFSH